MSTAQTHACARHVWRANYIVRVLVTHGELGVGSDGDDLALLVGDERGLLVDGQLVLRLTRQQALALAARTQSAAASDARCRQVCVGGGAVSECGTRYLHTATSCATCRTRSA